MKNIRIQFLKNGDEINYFKNVENNPTITTRVLAQDMDMVIERHNIYIDKLEDKLASRNTQIADLKFRLEQANERISKANQLLDNFGCKVLFSTL